MATLRQAAKESQNSIGEYEDDVYVCSHYINERMYFITDSNSLLNILARRRLSVYSAFKVL